jgi:hypothetical protein
MGLNQGHREMRTIRDGNGRSWRVWHVVPQSTVLRAAVPERTGGWLCYESDGDKRRLAGVHEGWEEMAEPALVEMLGRAAAVRVPVS